MCGSPPVRITGQYFACVAVTVLSQTDPTQIARYVQWFSISPVSENAVNIDIGIDLNANDPQFDPTSPLGSATTIKFYTSNGLKFWPDDIYELIGYFAGFDACEGVLPGPLDGYTWQSASCSEPNSLNAYIASEIGLSSPTSSIITRSCLYPPHSDLTSVLPFSMWESHSFAHK